MIRVMCADDNDLLAQAIERALDAHPRLAWAGRVGDARTLLADVRRHAPDVLLLDVDMPHRDSFEALAELTVAEPRVRVVVLSGHVRRDLVERALEAGAMGYLSKNEDTGVILRGIEDAAAGRLALGPESAAVFLRG